MNDVIARLAAANPVPVEHVQRRRRFPRRAVAAAFVAGAIAVPAVAFADDIGRALGISNPGTPVATGTLPEAAAPALAQAMQELGFPAQVRQLGTRDGFSFYAARNAEGAFCIAFTSPEGHGGVGCAPSGYFPSREHPVLAFAGPRTATDGGTLVSRLWGYAADGVASVDLLDAGGATVASAPVEGNVFADSAVPQQPVATMVARAADGSILWSRDLGPGAGPVGVGAK